MENNKKSYSEDHVVMILEELNGQFKVFGEGQQILIDKVGNLENKVDTIEEKLEVMEIRMINVENKVGSLENKVGSLENKVGSLENKVGSLGKDMKDQFMAFGEGQQVITDTLDGIVVKLDNKAEKSVADDYEKRIFKLEKTSLAA